MFNTAGLSLEQAPPISIPFRFFLTASLFAFAASVTLVVVGPDIVVTRWSPLTLGITHAFTLGVVSMVMCGALTQMLPVLAGTPMPGVRVVGPTIHLSVTLGAICLVLGFINSSGFWIWIGLGGLALGFGLLIGFGLAALHSSKHASSTVIAMRFALYALLITMLLGIVLGSGVLGRLGFKSIATIIDVHLVWGLLGWVAILVIGVSYQVVPMFMVTPEYPARARRLLAPGLFACLMVWSLLKIFALELGLSLYIVTAILLILAVTLIYFSTMTLHLQKQRKRKVPDVTLQFWRVAMVAVGGAALLWLSGILFGSVSQSPKWELALGVVMILGVAVSLVNGMLYKIVPFLSWFHLQNMQVKMMCFSLKIPNMKQFLPDKYARLQFDIYLVGLLASILAVVSPGWFARPAALLLSCAFGLLLFNLSKAVLLYRKTLRQLQQEEGGSGTLPAE